MLQQGSRLKRLWVNKETEKWDEVTIVGRPLVQQLLTFWIIEMTTMRL